MIGDRTLRADILAMVPQRARFAVEPEAVFGHQENHPQAEAEGFPEVAGDRRVADPVSIIDGDLDKRDPVRHHFHEQLRTEMRAADVQMRTHEVERFAMKQPVRASHVRKHRCIEQEFGHFGDRPVSPA
ncbi:MAG: hypothetical protein DMG59_06830 [Acidobacteria bacterium]|nr:MAG: hypothetical protein DMG59_06830 [Acidobacteriota bacterium]